MTADPVCCLATDTADHAAELMKQEGVGPIPVIEDEDSRKLVGIITDRDLALKVVAENRSPQSVHVQDVMVSSLVTCAASDPLDRALELMQVHQVRRIPVVDEDNCIVGIISQADVAREAGEHETAELVEEVSKPAADG
jgi:CBS-domain-containing membrane protein